MKSFSLVLAVGALVALISGAAAPTNQDVTRLQQELSNLKFRFDYETDRLERRLETVERQFQQVQNRVSTPLGTAPAPAPVAPLPTGDELVVRRLVVTDAAGNIRGVLAVSEVYGPMLGLLNRSGDVVGLFAAPEGGSRLELFDAAATSRVLLGHEGGAGLVLRDAAGELTAQLPVERR
jgi:hypothetical protein